MRSFLLAALLFASFAASAQLYRWTDERGRVHVTDTPPPPSAKNVRQRAADAAPAVENSNLPFALRRAMQNFPVTLFTAPECAPCGAARSLLNARGIPFREVSIVDQPQAEELKKAVGSLSVPSMRVGSDVHKGFEQGAYHAMLDSAGYPRAGVLPARNQTEPKPQDQPAGAPPAAQQGEQSEESESTGRPGPYAPR